MFVWAPIPEPYREMGSLEFSKFLVTEADVATSPGVGFGPGGDNHVRFALIENEPVAPRPGDWKVCRRRRRQKRSDARRSSHR
jgi:hypothetical protein